MKKLSQDSKYLENPFFPEKKKAESFKFLIDKIKGKSTSWRAKTLSYVSKMTLFKSFCNSVPTCTMSDFELPVSTCNKIDSLARQF